MREQATLGLGADALAVVATEEPSTCVRIHIQQDGPVDLRQLHIPGTAERQEPAPKTVYCALPRLFYRGGRVGRELRDGVFLSGAPIATGDGQYSFRQRRTSDGSWRLVTVFAIGTIKSVTEWSRYLPNHKEAAA